VANGGFMDRRRRNLSNGHVVVQLLEAPLRTPRRSCCGPPAPDALIIPRRFSVDSSPRRRLVPFSWETSPGVPRSVAMCREVLPPKPPPPPPGAGVLLCRASRETTTDRSSEDGGDTFSDAMNRTTSSDRLAALSARLSSMGSVAGSRRSPSFIMDRFLPAANAIATTSADIHSRRSPSPRRRSVGRDKHDHEEEAAVIARDRHVMNSPRSCALVRDQQHPKQQSPLHRRSKDAPAQSPLSPRSNEEERGDDTSATKVCGLMFFFPWRAKPVLLGFPLRSPRNTRAPNASVTASVTAAPSPPRRSVTLGDVLEKERRLREGGLEKSGSGMELARLGWGTTLLSTSKRYCADAKKAMSRLTRSATDGTNGPRLCTEQRGGKQGGLVPRSMSDKIPPLSPPSESWLCHARRSSAGSSKR
jgi:hypothetical protein